LIDATLLVPVALTKSMPSTVTSMSPRRRPAFAAGEPGSTIAASQVRGAVEELRDQVRP
jgi:hypothetical protein